jgi:radical SAM protein with 4Fe4S-binding SPASM domain
MKINESILMNEQKERDLSAPAAIYWNTRQRYFNQNQSLDALSAPLNTDEAKMLIDQICGFGESYPTLVFEGSNPFERRDLLELVRYAADRKLRTVIAAEALHFTDENLQAIKQAGAKGIVMSLESTPELATFDHAKHPIFFLTLRAAQIARVLGLQIRVRTTVTREVAPELPKIFRLVHRMGAQIWRLQFPTAAEGEQLSAADFEAVLHFVFEASAFLQIEVTEPQHYRRIAAQRIILSRKGLTAEILKLNQLYDALRAGLTRIVREEDLIGHNSRLVDFATQPFHRESTCIQISADGKVYPEGFPNRIVGNIRTRSLVDLYRNSWFFVSMRNLNHEAGQCGVCEFSSVCGGANERAYMLTGDPTAQENFCSYQPRTFPFQTDLMKLLDSYQTV